MNKVLFCGICMTPVGGPVCSCGSTRLETVSIEDLYIHEVAGTMSTNSERNNTMSVAEKVWQRLSAIDIKNKVEKKGNLEYLSWSKAWGILCDNFPDSYYQQGEDKIYPDGTYEVRMSVTVEDENEAVTRNMWLPVMDHRNKAIQHPDARQVSDARMRCLVKAIAMFGLGHSLYSGEDVPQATTEKKQLSAEHVDYINDLIKVYDFDVSRITKAYRVEALSDISDVAFDNIVQGIRKGAGTNATAE